jgi:hypothetical protein
VAINRGRLAERDTAPPDAPKPPATPVGRRTVILPWPYRPDPQDGSARPVPDVIGRSAREAALALHRRGFRVSLRGLGRVSRTIPGAGDSARPGGTVTVWAEEPQ